MATTSGPQGSLLPTTIHTIAIPQFGNTTVQYKISSYMSEAVTREFISKTRYRVVADPAQADATLRQHRKLLFERHRFRPRFTGRGSGAQLSVQVQIKLIAKDGKVIFTRPNFNFPRTVMRSVCFPGQYIDESQATLARVSRDLAKSVVSAVLREFLKYDARPVSWPIEAERSSGGDVVSWPGRATIAHGAARNALLAASTVAPETFDAGQTSLAAIIDDARAMSLFASERLLFVGNAEAAMPRTSRDRDDDDESGPSGSGDAALLASYAKSPTPGVVLVFEATRWDFDGDDKTKNDRVRKYYGAITDAVEFKRFSADEARGELDRIARASNVRLDAAAAEALVEALGADVGRIAVELEKLSLYGKPITAEDLPLLVPDARQSTIFALVNALGRRDRARSLDTLDALVREGEYLPLALTFLAGQFRMALVAKEANLRGPQQVQGHFQKSGVPMWGSRAEAGLEVHFEQVFKREQLASNGD